MIKEDLKTDVIQALKPFETMMYNAYKLKFVRASNDTCVELFKAAYGESWQSKVPSHWHSCSSCKLSAVESIGRIYYTYKDEVLNHEHEQ